MSLRVTDTGDARTADQPVLNVPLVEQIITHLTLHPEQHNQDGFGWVDPKCGTVCCVGGWAIVLDPKTQADWREDELCGGYIDGRWHNVLYAAQVALGVNRRTADSLFFDYGDTEHMIGRLKDLLNEASPAVTQ